MDEQIPTEVREDFVHWFFHALGPIGWLIVVMGVFLIAWGVAGFFTRSHVARLAHLFASFVPLSIGLCGMVLAVRAFEELARATNVKPGELGDIISAGLAHGIAGSIATLASGLLGATSFALKRSR